MPKEPRPASKATEAKAEEASKTAAQELVGKVVDALKKADSIEGLDEVYLHAESILSDSELESILVEYRTCKEAILKGKGGLFD